MVKGCTVLKRLAALRNVRKHTFYAMMDFAYLCTYDVMAFLTVVLLKMKYNVRNTHAQNTTGMANKDLIYIQTYCLLKH